MSSSVKKNYFVALDLGTTSTRALVIDKNFKIISGARFESKLIQDASGKISELDPEEYFDSIVQILREAIKESKIDLNDIISLGISCQRSTFITWDKVTGVSFHNLITWKDQRAEKALQKINNGFLLKFINNGSKVLYSLTKSDFFKVTSVLKIGNTFVNHRLQHFLMTNEKLKEAVRANRAMYGALDTWLLMRLKKDHQNGHVSDMTSSSSTGLYDSFKSDYSMLMLSYFNIKRSMLPKVVSNIHDFGYTHEDILGIPIRIDAIITDQAASLIANCCFRPYAAKITLGTGSFLQINVGEKCQGSTDGANPLVAWNIKNETIYKLEFMHQTSAESIKFIQTVGLCSDVQKMSDHATSVDHSEVFYVPKFHGFIGIKQSTTSNHLLRAVLESIIYTICHFHFLMMKDPKYRPTKIRIDGGISQNDFICQQIANLTGVDIERSLFSSDLTSLGCAYLCAYKTGILKSLEEAEKFYKSEKIFKPDMTCKEKLLNEYQNYLKILSQF